MLKSHGYWVYMTPTHADSLFTFSFPALPLSGKKEPLCTDFACRECLGLKNARTPTKEPKEAAGLAPAPEDLLTPLTPLRLAV